MLALVLDKTLRFLASTGLSLVLMALLFFLTLLGTLEQTTQGLYEVQQKYFLSPFFIHWFGPIPVPLPGAYLVMVVFAVNLILGGIYRMKWRLTKIGVLIAHFGVALLLLSGWASTKYAQHGQMALWEKDARIPAEETFSDRFVSAEEWELAVYPARPGESATEYIIPLEQFDDLTGEKKRLFRSESLPFELELTGFKKNSTPMRSDQAPGYVLLVQPDAKEGQGNLPALTAVVREQGSGREQEVGLWGGQRFPAVVAAGPNRWALDLRRVTRTLPFTIRLDKFHHELHPGTGMAKVYLSDVTKIENGVEQPIKITMNEPLRHKGYTLYQSSWGPSNARPGQPLYSVFAVVANPADKFPLWATLVISLGILVHFVIKLVRFLVRREGKA